MKKVFIVINLCVIILCLSCTQASDKKLKYYKSKYAHASIDEWSRINLKNAIIENNVFGKEYGRNNFQIIFSDSTGSEFGWYWDYAYTTKRISASPVHIVGKKPWFDTTTNTLMPIKIADIDSLFCEFDYTSNATGNYENSLGIWITNKKKSNDTSIVFQMVCVFGDVGTDKLGTYTKTLKMGNIETDVYFYRGKEIYFGMLLFYLKTKDSNLKLNLKEYLNYLITNKYIEKSDYAASVELATSPKWGTGETVYKNFNFVISSK
jgi:hypothetical protein